MHRVTRISAERGSPARHGGAAEAAARHCRDAPVAELGEPRRSMEIGALASRLATELGDGVSACVFRAQVLKRRAVRGEIGPSEVAELAEKIIDGLEPLVERLDAWVEFARSRTFALETVDPEEFFAELAATWRPQAAACAVALRVATDSPLPAIRMDRAKMRLVFDHLVANALDATSGPGHSVTIRVRACSPVRVRISIEDEGRGVPTGVELFSLFSTTKPAGSGLGLAIAKEIVNAHGGEIDYRSTERGGSEFAVEIPVKPPIAMF
jgi:signal transduction histidine kinase